MNNEFGEWIIGINTKLNKAKPKKRAKMLEELSEELHKLCDQIQVMDPFEFFVWLRFEIILPVLEEKKILLNPDLEILFINEFRDNISKPSHFLIFMDITFPLADEANINPLLSQNVLVVLMEVLKWAIQNFDTKPLDKDVELQREAVQKIYNGTVNYFQNAKIDPAAKEPILGGTIKGQIYHLILISEECLIKLCGK